MRQRCQSGFTLIELIIGISIMALVGAVPGMLIYQFFAVTEQNGSQFSALEDLQNASLWFTRDGQQAKAALGGTALTLALTDGSTIAYSLVGSAPRYRLQRASSSAPSVNVARNITSADFSVAGSLVTMTLTSTPGGRWDVSATKTYQVYMRYKP